MEFMGVTAPYGLNRGEVRINNGDAFADDDHYNFAVERSDPAPALFIYDPAEARSLFYFQTALTSAAQPAFTLSGSSFAQAAGYDMSRQSFVVLSDPATLTRGLQSALEKYVSGGGSLFIVLGRNASGQVPLADLSLERLRSAEPGQFFSVTSVDATHPVLQATPHWDGIRVFQYVPVTPGTARVLAQLNTGDPLILERQIGAGRVMVLTSPLNRIANDLPLAPLFVPFVEQLASYLGHADTATANFTAGAFYDLRPPGASNDVPVEVTGPSGERVLSLSEATKSRSLLLEHAGFYDIRRPDGHRELVAVNPDPRESDLTLVPEETMTLWKNTGEKSVNAGSGVASPKRTQLWWYVLMAALILAVAESLAGNKHLSAKEGSHEPA